MNYKELKKLADTCRKAGIKHFKNAEIEFTLSDEGPISNYRKKSPEPLTQAESSSTFQSDSLTEEQLLLYSVRDFNTEDENEQGAA